MSDKIKVPEMIRMSIRNEMGMSPKSYYNTDINVLVTPTSFIQDEDLFDEMTDDLKKNIKTTDQQCMLKMHKVWFIQ